MSHLKTLAPKITDVSQLRQLHAYQIRNALHHPNYWLALLLNQCKRMHAPHAYTLLLFHSATNPDSNVFMSMLEYCSLVGSYNEVVSVYKRMQCYDVKLETFVYPALIKSCGKSGIMFHAHVLKLGHAHDRFVRNALMGVHVKYGEIHMAWKMFDEMPDRSIADWNLMISGLWRCGHKAEASGLFDMMTDRNVISWTSMVTGYANSGDLNTARMYFDKMPVKSVVSWNAMLSGYAHHGLAKEALSLFDEMLNSGYEPNETTWVTIISSCSCVGDSHVAEKIITELYKRNGQLNYYVKTALLDMYAKCGKLEAARNVFDELGWHKNAIAWNAMIAGYTKVGDLTLALDFFYQMPKRDIISWNSMISGYAQNGQSPMAIQLFRKMVCSKVKPDEVTMISVISACGHLGSLEFGNWAVKIANENHIKLSILGFNSLVFMYSKCGSMEDALRVFQRMETRDVVSYNTLITGFAAYGFGIEAINLMSEMRDEGIEPDRVTYIGVLTACSHAGLLEEGRQVFDSIQAPSVDHYACMVDLLGRVGKLDEVKKLIDIMPMEPHAGVYGSLLNACRIHGKVELGELAATKLFKLEPYNSGNYVLLSNLYASARRWEDVNRVRDMMRRYGVKKSTGQSLVEHQGKMHKFIVGGRSHELSNDIYKLLGDLRVRMKSAGYMVDNSCVLRDVVEEEKEDMVGVHSEKLAICFALLVSERGTTIRVMKNLRVCSDCHDAIKFISKLEGRTIIVRDNNRFHCFTDGLCSCKDYW